MNKLRQQYADKETQLTSQDERFRAFVAANTATLVDKSKQLAENEERIAELNKACDVRVAQESEKCNDDILKCRNHTRKLQEQIDILTNQAAALNQEIEKHIGGKTEASELIEKSRRDNSEIIKLLTISLQTARAKYESLLQKSLEYAKEREADEDEIARLTEEVAELRIANQEVRKLKEKYVSDVQELSENAEYAWNKLEEVEEKRRIDRHQTLETAMENVNSSIERTERLNKNTMKSMDIRETTRKVIDGWRTKHQEALDVAEDLRAKIRESEDHLKDTAKTHQNYVLATKQAEVLLAKVADLESFIDQRNEIFRQTENNYTSLKHEVEILRRQLENASEERDQCETFMQENAELRRENEHLRERINEMLSQNAEISADELSED